MNQQHQAGTGLDGVTGRNFFDGTDAESIKVSAPVENDLNAIAAATPPVAGSTVAPGNGDNALALARLQIAKLFGDQNITDFYGAKVTSVGSDVAAADRSVTNQGSVVQQLQNSRNSVSGVSLDEELTHMLEHQRAYQAAAKLLTTYDNLLDSIMNIVK